MHNRPMRAAHVFVDETKERGLLLTAAAMLPGDLHTARKHMRGLVMPRQRRIHFFREGDARRKKILDVITDLAPICTIYDSSRHSRRQQRETCLQALVADLASAQAQMLVLERDDSIIDLDRRLLYRHVHNAGYPELRYEHLRAREEPLLAIPDAIAWCWQRGGHWRERVRELVAEVRVL